MDAKEIERQQKKLEEGKFTLRDLAEQMDGVEEIGGFDKMLGMIPGMGKVKDKIPEVMVEGQEAKVKKWKHIVKSMTEKERLDPSLMNRSRVERIAKGAGKKDSDVRELLKNFKKMKKMFKQFKGMNEKSMQKMGEKDLGKMMQQMQGKKAMKKKFRLR